VNSLPGLASGNLVELSLFSALTVGLYLSVIGSKFSSKGLVQFTGAISFFSLCADTLVTESISHLTMKPLS
jgi:hypothetical protein